MPRFQAGFSHSAISHATSACGPRHPHENSRVGETLHTERLQSAFFHLKIDVLGGGMDPKIIVLLADGTGNSAAKLFKTNVWRLYRALDVSDPPPPGQVRQVAFYHDGVGTSTFKPLTLLGGIFGIGLKRNVIDLYTFLCRNYNPGDRIYAYGFSRGAFRYGYWPASSWRRACCAAG